MLFSGIRRARVNNVLAFKTQDAVINGLRPKAEKVLSRRDITKYCYIGALNCHSFPGHHASSLLSLVPVPVSFRSSVDEFSRECNFQKVGKQPSIVNIFRQPI